MDVCLTLRWASEQAVLEPTEPSQFVLETDGEIYNVADDDDEELAGKFRVYYVDADRALDAGIAPFDVFDTSSSTINYFETLFRRNGVEFLPSILRSLDYHPSGISVLILDRLEILPKFRRGGLGLEILRSLIHRFGLASAIVAMKVYPLQFELPPTTEEEVQWHQTMGLDLLPPRKALATDKLRRYYSKLGFAQVARTAYMARATDLPF